MSHTVVLPNYNIALELLPEEKHEVFPYLTNTNYIKTLTYFDYSVFSKDQLYIYENICKYLMAHT
jgi:hypothetical protein